MSKEKKKKKKTQTHIAETTSTHIDVTGGDKDNKCRAMAGKHQTLQHGGTTQLEWQITRQHIIQTHQNRRQQAGTLKHG